MSSLFKRLLKYQESQSRSNLENYVTEILADYLNRISTIESRLFIDNILFNSCSNGDFSSFSESHGLDSDRFLIEWKTQQSIYVSGVVKYPDLLGFINKKPAILIEAKIRAPFTQRIYNDEEGNLQKIPQLVDYGKWLSKKNPDGILILLTYSTKPPDNYYDNPSPYSIEKRNCINWQLIYNWLERRRKKQKCSCLAEYFMEFLLEENMAIKSPDITDLSVLELFVYGAGKRIGGMMEHTRSELEKSTKKTSIGERRNPI